MNGAGKRSRRVVRSMFAFLLLMLSFALCNIAAFAEEDDYFELQLIRAYYGRRLSTGAISNTSNYFWYGDDMLMGDAKEFSSELTKVSAMLALCAYKSNDIIRTLESMEFTVDEELTLSSYNRSVSVYDNDHVGFSVAFKNITYAGEAYRIYCVPVRGTPGNSEWFSDFNLGDESNPMGQGNHEGFYKAASELIENLENRLDSDGYDSAHTVVWTMGHSRGAAVANIVAGKMTDSSLVDAGRVFGYTFACPAVSKNINNASGRYNNIYNFNNSGDFVPEIPLKKWGYKRYGITKTLDMSHFDNFSRMYLEVMREEYGALESVDGVIQVLEGISEKDYNSPENKLLFLMAGYALGGHSDTHFYDLLIYAGFDVGEAAIKQVFSKDWISHDSAYDRVCTLYEDAGKLIDSIQTAIGQVSDMSEENFDKWLTAHQTLGKEISTSLDITITCAADLSRALTSGYALQQALAEFRDLLGNIVDFAGKIGNSFSQGHDMATYVLWLNSMYYGYHGWYGNNDISSIVIPADVSGIGEQCFVGCDNLQSITFPSQMLFIGSEAFRGCSGLTGEIKLPESMKALGADAFSGCTGLIGRLVVPDGIAMLEVRTFKGCKGLEELVIPDSVEVIDEEVFSGCVGLRKVQMPVSARYNVEETSGGWSNYPSDWSSFEDCADVEEIIYTIGSGEPFEYEFSTDYKKGIAYRSRYTLKRVQYPEGLEKISSYALTDCSEIVEIVLPESLKEVGDSAFSGCSSWINSEYEWLRNVERIGSYAFRDCSGLTGDLVFSEKLKEIGIYSFEACSGIRSVCISEGIECLASYAFSKCTGLEELALPNTLKEIQAAAFSGCVGLKKVTIPISTVYEKEKWASFSGCTNIEEIKYILGTGIWYSDDDYLHSITGYGRLKKVSYPDGLESICSYSLYDCSSVEEIVLPTSLKEIGAYAFYGCRSWSAGDCGWLRNVERIGSYAFWNCSGLTGELILPGILETVEERAFSGCKGLSGVRLQEGICHIGDGAFYDCSGMESLVLPDTTEDIGRIAFANCTGLHNVTMPVSAVYEVDSEYSPTFYRCEGIEEICYTLGTGEMFECGEKNYYRSIHFESYANLKRVVFPEGLKRISNNALRDAGAVEEIVLPSTLEEVGNYAFSDCRSWEAEGYSWLKNIVKIGDYAFYNCEKWKVDSYEWLEWAEDIGKYAFFGCDGFTGELVFPGEHAEIAEGMFSNCEGLAKVRAEEGIFQIGNRAFYGCSAIESLVLPDTTENIGELAFAACSALQSVAMPVSATYSSASFAGCDSVENLCYTIGMGEMFEGSYGIPYQSSKSLKRVEFPEGLEKICECALYNAYSVQEIILPTTLREIASKAFSGCKNWKNDDFTWLEKIEKIGDDAFSGCVGLTGELTLPDSLVELGSRAFYECSGLSGYLYIPGSISMMNSETFYRCSRLEGIQFGEGIQNIGYRSFSFCYDITEIVIPESVTEMEGSAFPKRATIYGIPGSYAETYAEKNNNPFVALALWKAEVTLNLDQTELDLEVGDTVSLHADVTPPEAAEWLSWASGDSGVASVDGHGTVTANGVGRTEISVQLGKTSAACSVTVSDKVPVMPEQLIEGSEYYGVTYGDPGFVLDACLAVGNGMLSYASSDEGVVVVDMDGNVTIIGAGTADIIITASATEDYRAARKTVRVTVEKAEQNLQVSYERDAIAVGETMTITAWSDTLDLSYASDNDRVAFVDESGNVTGLAAGFANITVYTAGDANRKSAEQTFPLVIYAEAEQKINLISCYCILSQDTYLYDGSPKEPEVTIYSESGIVLTRGVDYEIGYVNNINPGWATVQIIALPDGQCSGMTERIFMIREALREDATEVEAYAFNGCDTLFDLRLRDTITKIGDYAFAGCENLSEIYFYGNAPEFGVGVFEGVEATAYYPADNSTWTLDKLAADYGGNITWLAWDPATEQLTKRSLTVCRVQIAEPSCVYDGMPKTPDVIVTDGELKLIPGTDYTVSYADNVNAGAASIQLNGAGEYGGTITTMFAIAKANPVLAFAESGISRNFSDAYFQNTLQTAVTDGAITYSSGNVAVAAVDPANGTGTIRGVGTAVITAAAAEGQNYLAGSASYTVTVQDDRSEDVIPTAGTTVEGETENDQAAVPSAPAVTAPKGVRLKKLRSGAGGKLTVTWKKNKAVNGYEIQYSTDKKFLSGIKKKTVKKKTITVLKLSGLKAGKTYYVRIRTYKKINGKKYYSAWSKVKSARIKK